jgi:hypothetical protein
VHGTLAAANAETMAWFLVVTHRVCDRMAQVAVASNVFAMGTLECSVIRWHPGSTEMPVGVCDRNCPKPSPTSDI